MGIAVGLTATAAYVIGRATEPAAAQTMAFATLACAELVLVFSIRSGTSAAWRAPRNPLLLTSVLVSFVLLVLSIYLAPLRDAFGTEPLELLQRDRRRPGRCTVGLDGDREGRPSRSQASMTSPLQATARVLEARERLASTVGGPLAFFVPAVVYMADAVGTQIAIASASGTWD